METLELKNEVKKRITQISKIKKNITIMIDNCELKDQLKLQV